MGRVGGKGPSPTSRLLGGWWGGFPSWQFSSLSPGWTVLVAPGGGS